MSNIHSDSSTMLDERFREPEGWRWHSFKRNGRTLRFGSASPKDSIPNAVVIAFPGLSEYAEKYFENARWCLENNLAFWILDWYGQGGSGRYLKNNHKRHIRTFQDDVDDAYYFINEYVKYASVHPDKGRIPLALMAHSMGGHIGMHFLKKYPGIFECAAFSAPMLGIKALDCIPAPIYKGLSSTLNLFADQCYVLGGGAWSEDNRGTEQDTFSHDMKRNKIHNHWMIENPQLQIGSITYGWLHQAIKSCSALYKKGFAEDIETPCVISTAGEDVLVSNKQIERFASRMPECDLKSFPNAYHEILMEKDEIRDDFFKNFYNLITRTIIDRPETLKPF